jgi:hypothetical protein
MLSSAVVKITPLAVTQTFASGLYEPVNITGDSNGNLYVIDFFDDIIKVSANGVKSPFAGNTAGQGYADGQGALASFNNPTALTCDAAGNVYIADNGNARVRKATPTGLVTTISGIYVVGVREMTATPDGNSLYMRASNSGDTSTTKNISYYSGGSNAGTITLSGLTYPEDVYARTVSFNQNGFAYFSPANPQGQGPKLYRIGTPVINTGFSAFSITTPVNDAAVGSYPGSNSGSYYTQFSNILISGGTIVIFNNVGGPWRILNNRTIVVGFSNVTSDPYPLQGTFIDLNNQLWTTGLAGMSVEVTGGARNPFVSTTLISTQWATGTNYFISGGNLLLNFSNDVSSVIGTGQIRMETLTGAFEMYNTTVYSVINCNSTSSPFQYQITVSLPTAAFQGSPTFSTVSASASVFGVSGVPATLSNLFSPSANVLTGMSTGYLLKYTLSGDVATEEYSCNISLYNGIGGVPNLASTIIPEVYTLIPGAGGGANGTILVIRNIY